MLHNGDFCKIAIRVAGAGVRNSSELKKAFLHVHDGSVYLLSHVQTLNEGAEGVPMHGMRCITRLCTATLFDDLAQIAGDSERIHGCTITFYNDAESVAAVHGRATANTGNRRARPVRTEPEALQAAAGERGPEESPAASSIACDDFHVLGNYTRNMYEGFRGYHASHEAAMNSPIIHYSGWRIGVELETEFETTEARGRFTGTPRNWYFCERDGSLGRAGCEIVTIPLMPDDAKDRATWKPLCNCLRELGATSWDNGRCGLHVHIGREILGGDEAERERNLSKLLLFYNLHLNNDETCTKVFGRARCYHECLHDQTQEFAAVKCLGVKVLKDKEISEKVGKAVKDRNNTDRYYAINTTNRNTIEFRKGRGSLSVDRIQAIITFCEAVCLYVKTSDNVAELTEVGFREYIRANVPTTNALYRYYSVIEEDM